MEFKKLLNRVFNSPTLMTWGSFFIKAINAVLVLPLVLSKFPSDEVGIWLLFLLIQNLINLTDVGFTQSFSRAIAYAYGGAKDINHVFVSDSDNALSSPNWPLIAKILKVMNKVYVITSLTALGLMLTVGTYYIYKPIHQIANSAPYWNAWMIITACSPFVIYGIKYTTYLVGTNRIAFVKRIDMGFSTMSVLCSICIILFAPSIFWIVVNTQFWLLANVLRDYLIVKKDKNLREHKNVAYDKALFPIVWNSSWRSAIGMIGSYGVQQFTGIYFAQGGNTPIVVAYLLSLRIMNTVVDFSRAPFYSKLPVLSALRAQGSNSQLLAVAKKGMIITVVTFTGAVILIGLLHTPILHLIKSKTSFVDNRVWALMCIAFLLERYGALHIQLYSITNKIIWHKANVMTGLLTILIIVAFHKTLGIYVFPIAMIISNGLFYSWYSASHSYKEFKMPFWSYEKYILLTPGIALILYFVSTLFI